MTIRFADTSFFVALISESDRFHSRARQYWDDPSQRLVLTEAVVFELANFLSRHQYRERFLALLQLLESDSRITIVPNSRELFDLALALYRARPDKDWSLTDCLSFVVMEQQGIREALTADHHFQQAGFRVLLS